MELKKLYESMLLEKEGQRREGTHAFYKAKGKKVLEYFENKGITTLEQLTYDEVNRFLIDLKKVKKLSEKTVVDYYGALRQIILIYTGTRTRELKKILEISLTKPVSIHRKPLTDEQTALFIDFIDSIEENKNNHRGLKEKVIFMISLQSGIRCNELVNILVNQVDFDSKTIHLVATKSHKERNISKNQVEKACNVLLRSTEASILVLEDLTKIKVKTSKTKEGFKKTRHNNALSQVPLYMFKERLTHKAQLVGKRVETVSPVFTSQTDSRTNKRDGIRKGCNYICSDGIVLDADWNASVNIAHRANHPLSSNELPLSGRVRSITQSSEV